MVAILVSQKGQMKDSMMCGGPHLIVAVRAVCKAYEVTISIQDNTVPRMLFGTGLCR